MVDFEKAVCRALRQCLPEVSVRGCWFHWAQAVYRHVKEYGLRGGYIHQLTIRTYIRELTALPNLPATHIEPAFMEMKARCPPRRQAPLTVSKIQGIFLAVFIYTATACLMNDL